MPLDDLSSLHPSRRDGADRTTATRAGHQRPHQQSHSDHGRRVSSCARSESCAEELTTGDPLTADTRSAATGKKIGTAFLPPSAFRGRRQPSDLSEDSQRPFCPFYTVLRPHTSLEKDMRSSGKERNRNRHKTITDTPKLFSIAHSKLQQATATKARKP